MGPEANRTSAGVRGRRIALLVVAIAVLVVALLLLRRRTANATDVEAGRTMQLTSASFANSDSIPSRYTCDGDGISPSMAWSGAPAATKSFALIMHDPDAPVDFTHWLAYNIPPNVHELAEGASNDGAMPHGAAEGVNGFRRMGYGGPCPPAGKAHRYVFLVYALDTNPGLPAGVTREQVESAVRSHIVATGRLTATYGRSQ